MGALTLAALALTPASAAGNSVGGNSAPGMLPAKENGRVAAREMALREHSSPTTTNTTTPTSSPVSPDRRVYCFGDPGHGTNGWQSDGTSLGWIRQGYAGALAERVVYDDSVEVMQSLGCHTVRAEIQANDPDANGGTSNQRAQLYANDSTLAQSGGQPSLDAKMGKTSWYGFAFATNSGYVPHYHPVFGNWNAIFSWHNAPINGVWGPLANIMLEVATIGPRKGREYKCGVPLRKLSQPRLNIQINGGDQDDTTWPSEGRRLTCRRYLGPAFTAGHRYRVQMRVRWGAHMGGALQVWIDGTKYVDVRRVSNMWYRGSTVDNGIYAVFQNYSYYNASLPTRSVYYGGLIRGASLSDVGIPLIGGGGVVQGQSTMAPSR